MVPQIETILEENGLLNGVKGIEMLDRIRTSPQDFLPKVGPLKDLPRLIETAKKVVGVEENMEAFALAAAATNAQVGTAELYLDCESFCRVARASCTVVMNCAGKMIVEFFSVAISAMVCRVRNCSATGCAVMMSAASPNFTAA